MYSLVFFILVLLLPQCFTIVAEPAPIRKSPRLAHRRSGFQHEIRTRNEMLVPKLFIINMVRLSLPYSSTGQLKHKYDDEGYTWLSKESLGLYANNITIPGLSPLFPDAHCTETGDVCEITTGEGQINAAVSMTALTFSSAFNLTKTYFMIAGNAGINPECGTTGSVAFSRYVVEVAMQYEIDPRDISTNYSAGYIPQGAAAPDQYPAYIYGTEVFELNAALRDRAVSLASNATLQDNALAKTYRAQYPHSEAAASPPSVFSGDTASSDVWFSGQTLSDAFANYTILVTNGTGRYCMTAQEDSGSLEALLRADLACGRVDFSRVLLMRTASDFDRPPPGVSVEQNLIYEDSGGLDLSYENMYAAGMEIVEDVRRNWKEVYEGGIPAQNYMGDILNSLNGSIKPDFG